MLFKEFMKHTFSVALFQLSLQQVFHLILIKYCNTGSWIVGENLWRIDQGSSLTEMGHTISVVTGIKFIENTQRAELQKMYSESKAHGNHTLLSAEQSKMNKRQSTSPDKEIHFCFHSSNSYAICRYRQIVTMLSDTWKCTV